MEGDVTRVGCPDPTCVKEGRQASVEDVKSIVSPNEVSRWQQLLRKRELEQGTKPPRYMYICAYSDQIQELFPALSYLANSRSYPHRLQKTVAHRNGIVSESASVALHSACIVAAHGMVHTPPAPFLQPPNLLNCIYNTQRVPRND